jgi:predicted metal-dependent hydrolase
MDDQDSLFEEGLALFNAGRFFQCHEVWELAWRRASGIEKNFLQGMIQSAVALLHAERGNRRGAASVHAKARARLDTIDEVYAGIALNEFRVALANFFGTLCAGNEPPPHPQIRRIK